MHKSHLFSKITLKKLCILSLMTAITAILSIYCTFRIGNAIKIPFKFVSVFFTAVMFGPFWGGIIAVLGDILNVFLAPSGPWIPLITGIEFLNGAVFGIFFYKHSYETKNYFLRTLICCLILFLIDMILTSLVLTYVGYFPTFASAIIVRFPAGVIKILIQGVFIIISKGYIKSFKQMGGKDFE